MAYLELKKIGYQLHQDPQAISEEYNKRFNSIGTIKTNLFPSFMNRDDPSSKQYELFVVPLPEIYISTERITNNSKLIQKIADDLPHLAGMQFFYDTLSKEIISTNEIEGVRSTRKELEKAINAVEKKNTKNVRLASTVKMYMATFEDRNIQIKNLADIRLIYDKLLNNEIKPDDMPDGLYFRKDSVKIVNASGQAIHYPPVGEEQINNRLEQWVSFINNKQIPFLVKALTAHFFFENTHPFYDGNGRTGRYILSTYLSRKLDKFTGMSFSQIVNAQKSKYYEAFKITGDNSNYGEATFFVLTILQLIEDSQHTIIESLNNKQEKLARANKAISALYKHDTVENFVLSLLSQVALFSDDTETNVKDMDIIAIAKKNNLFNTNAIKKAFIELTEKKYLIQTSSKPLKHHISPAILDD
ncbi:Fic family protein [Leuconostoc suionicum]|uniref:Fic family protein n=1 Tax=Leuconostoc suionicum TaxID=1511761 RepID=UPI0032DFD7BC